MAEKLYLECQSGISGDMTVASLLDLGADETVLRDALASLPLEGYEIAISRVKKSGIGACDFSVILDEEHENHDHDMAYLHGHEHHHVSEEDTHRHLHASEEHTHGYHHASEGDTHEHTHEHHHAHEHRTFRDVLAIVEAGKLTSGARELAEKIFTILAEAEAAAHGTTMEEVHFHEVGAVDSIVDIVGAAVCLDNLGIKDVMIPVLCEGTGTIRCQHGILSIPVPAVANIAAAHQLHMEFTTVMGELVTPTGAAIAAAIRTGDKLPSRFVIKKIGIGAGKRNYERPSILRAMLIESSDDDGDVIVKLECNVDDCSGEAFGYCMEQLFAAGARDVYYTPVYMKKNRPAYEVSVLCDAEDVEKMEGILFTETTTIGIRRTRMERTILKRQIVSMETTFGSVEVKICEFQGKKWAYPEYESVKCIAGKQSLSYLEVYQRVYGEIENKLS